MQQTIDYTELLQMIRKMEQELQRLRLEVFKLRAQQVGKLRNGTRKAKSKSAYGMFPPCNTTMEDFRDARKSWTRNLDRMP